MGSTKKMYFQLIIKINTKNNCEYFRKHYENSTNNPKPILRKIQNINRIMFCGNAIVILLIVF